MGDEKVETPSTKEEQGALDQEHKTEKHKEENKEEKKLTPFNEHPDWKKMYRQVKTSERENETLREDIESLREANVDLLNTVQTVDDKMFEMKECPDFAEDPKGFQKYMLEMAKREIKKGMPKVEPQVKPTKEPVVNDELNTMELVEASLHTDYNEIVKGITAIDMREDDALRLTIMQSENPAKAAYEYGVRKKSTKERLAQHNKDAGYVEGGKKPDESKIVKPFVLSSKQKRACRLMNVSEKQFLIRLEEQNNFKK